MTDVLKALLNAETLLGNHPLSRLRSTELRLCESCHAVYTDEGEHCAECESERLIIDLTRKLDIDCYMQEYAPASQRYAAVDRNTYEGVGRSNIIGMGATKASAIRELLDLLAEK